MFKKEILLVGSVPPPIHGSTIYFQNLLNSKIKEIFEIILLDTGDNRDDLDNMGKIEFVNVIIGLKNILQLIYFLVIKKPDLVYLNTSQGISYLREGTFVIITKLFSKAIIIEHLHGASFKYFFENANIFLKKFINLTQNKIDYAIVLGNCLKTQFDTWFKEENIFVAYNGINVTIRDNLFNPDLPKLFFISNLFKFKGFLTAVESIKFLKGKYPEIELYVAGKWADDKYYNITTEDIRTKYEEIISAYDLKNNIKIMGPVYDNDKNILFENSDIFIYPTENDGSPLVILEAMAQGLPVITTTIGALSEIVIDGVTGLLVDKQNPKAVADAIIKLIENPQLRMKMGKAGRKRYEEHFTLDKNIDRMVDIFNNILKE